MHHEAELISPAINAIKAMGGSAGTGDLIAYLKVVMSLDAEDREELPSGQIRFDRTVGNLRSHNVLLNMGLVTYDTITDEYILTDKGLAVPANKDFTSEMALVRSNKLSLQQTMVKYVKETAQVNFVNSMAASTTIMRELKKLPKFNNDYDRRTGVGEVIDVYVQKNPKNVT